MLERNAREHRLGRGLPAGLLAREVGERSMGAGVRGIDLEHRAIVARRNIAIAPCPLELGKRGVELDLRSALRLDLGL